MVASFVEAVMDPFPMTDSPLLETIGKSTPARAESESLGVTADESAAVAMVLSATLAHELTSNPLAGSRR